uniref:Uncharacterized protein n=1 Tax=Panagrolaimus sp. PS1159 TaxID=55785 RepID=A0AC35F8Y2_9BILA
MFSNVFLFSLIAGTVFIGSGAAQHTCLNYYEQKHLNDDMKKMFEQEKKLIMDFICEKVDAAAIVATHT